MKKLLLIIMTSFALGCTHQKTFESHLEGGQCSDAFTSIPELQVSNKRVDSANWVARNVLAYTYIGMNYTAEVLWDASVGVVGSIALCLPMVAVLAATNNSFYGVTPNGMPSYGHNRLPGCLPKPSGAKNLFSPPLGRNAMKDTQLYRCPNVKGLAVSLEKVAICYERKRTKEDLEKAVTSLEGIESSRNFFSCLEPEYQKRVVTKKEEIEKRLLAM